MKFKDLSEMFLILNKAERFFYFVLFIFIILGGLVDMIGVISLAAILYSFNNTQLDSNFIFFLGEDYLQLKLLLIYVLSTFWRFFSQGAVAYTALHFESKLSSKLFENSLKMDTDIFNFENSSTFKKEILTEVQVVTNQIVLPGLRIFQSILSSFFILGYLIIVSPKIFLYGFVGIIIFFAVASYILSIFSKKLGESRFEANEKRFSILEDSMKSIRLIKIFKISGKYLIDYVKQMNIYAFSQSMLQIIGLLPRVLLETLLISFLMIYAINNSDQIIEQFFLLGASLFRLIPNLQIISQNFARLSFGSIVLKQTLSRLRLKIDSKDEPFELLASEKNIAEIKNSESSKVEFILQEKLIEKIVIPKIGTVMLRGESGVGKTTLIDKLIGISFLDNYSIKKSDYFKMEEVFFVPQAISISSGTYKDNLKLLLNKMPEDEEIKSVFANLRIKHLFERLILNDEKIGSSIEFSGISGGELKRIFLSFCLLSKRKIFILDEIFSGIDSNSSEIICDIFNAIKKEKLILIVAHEKFKNIEVDFEYRLRRKN